MPVIQAQDIVNAVIQDSQNQTTNRSALYDYTDRIHQRILRETQWRFLLSDPQAFITMPGVSRYTVVPGPAPAGAFLTNLDLTDFGNIVPGTVFNLTGGIKIEEDSDTTTTTVNYLNQDASLRTGLPRTYANSLANPGTLALKPAPDGQNLYYPVPETPVVGYASGATLLPNRIYWGVVTFVDAFGGESTACPVPFTVAVPAGSLLTVESPDRAVGGIAGNQLPYSGWNLYVGYTPGVYNRQNGTPISIGTDYTEPVLGINTGTLSVPSIASLTPPSMQTVLSIDNTGFLETINVGHPVVPNLWALRDTSGQWWAVTTDTNPLSPTFGQLITVAIPSSPIDTNVFDQLYLTDIEGISTWKITVQTSGLLQSTVYATPPVTSAINGQPPQSPTIQPLNAYVIQFRYNKARNKISTGTDTLQIPYIYKDIVIAGVNYLANLYIDKQNQGTLTPKTMSWKKDFEDGLAQIRRDLRMSYRKVDYISPDIQTQYVVANQQGIPTVGW